MAGIYLHIPFCKSKCYYCDFYSITNLTLVKDFIESVIEEIQFRKNFFKEENDLINTIYFGGGTPSVLRVKEIEIVINEIFKNFKINNFLEFTIELNPDDVNKEYVLALKSLGINRISLGLQTFNDNILKVINRRHTSKESIKSLDTIFENGFQNVSADLIYGLPFQTIEDVENDLLLLLKYPIKHISAYSLTIENNSYIKYLIESGKLIVPDEDLVVKQYEKITKTLEKENFIHYEISNFAIDGYYSIHNSNYWKLEKYLGLGPSAHSFDKICRYMNISDLYRYIEKIKNKETFFEYELLDNKDKYNEYILTGLRTIWGVSIKKIESDFPEYSKSFKNSIKKYLNNYIEIVNKDIVRLTEKGMLIGDRIIMDCFVL